MWFAVSQVNTAIQALSFEEADSRSREGASAMVPDCVGIGRLPAQLIQIALTRCLLSGNPWQLLINRVTVNA